MMEPPHKVPLTRGLFALVDAADRDLVSVHRWSAVPTSSKRNNHYAQARIGKAQVKLHRLLMAPPPGLVVDHINGDGLDNRRANLRVCTQAENARNGGHPATAPLSVGVAEPRGGRVVRSPADDEPVGASFPRPLAPGYLNRFDAVNARVPFLTMEEFEACFPEVLDPDADVKRLLAFRGWTWPPA